MQAWIAIFAILLNALAPSISHALARADARMAEICSAPGAVQATTLMKSPTTTPLKSSTAPSAMMQDCGYCLVHGGTDMLAPPAPLVTGIGAGHALRPLLFYHAPTPLLALSAAPPRGPPTLV